MADAHKPLTLDDLIAFNGELAAIVRAGVPLELGLRGGAAQWRTNLARFTERLAVRMQQGASLPDALAAEQTLPDVYRAVVTAGLRSGRLPEALEGLSRIVQFLRQMRQRLALAMIYPALVLTLSYVIWLTFLVYFVPDMTAVFVDMRREPGEFLKFLQRAAATMAQWWWIPPLAVLVTGCISTLSGKFTGPAGIATSRWLGPLVLIPGMRRVLRDYEISAVADITGLLVAQQVPLPEAFELATGAVGNRNLQQTMTVIIGKLQQGSSFADAASHTDLPPYFRWLVQVGIAQGRLADALTEGAEYYRRKAESLADWLQLIIPVGMLSITCGAIVLLYCLTIFAPFRELLERLATEP